MLDHDTLALLLAGALAWVITVAARRWVAQAEAIQECVNSGGHHLYLDAVEDDFEMSKMRCTTCPHQETAWDYIRDRREQADARWREAMEREA